MGTKVKYIHNCETGETIVREMTKEEIDQENANVAAYAAVIAAEDARAATKEAARAKLEALGLTINDLEALGL